MTEAKAQKPGWLGLVVDYGPILLFFVVYKYYSPSDRGDMIGEIAAVVRGTIAFMGGAIVAFAVSLIRFRHVSPMLWLTTAMILFFGGLTVWTQDPAWISHKPTVVYLFGAVMLLGGWLRGKALLKILLGAAFEGLDDAGWMKLSRNWGLFFIALAAINEVLANRDWFTFEQWLQAKLWLFLPLSFVFTFAHMPMLLRHGLASEAKDEAEATTPHE
ncbi:intracellular septation protein A [Novosphingobium sp. TH158]|nr:inner membrane-spanning protein YciB [Novosphingobium sp. TH158]PLK27730.1 intracellular septation protein A [Novosphingobium sp. TH158]